MILYSLTNLSLSLDVYEDKVVLRPKIWRSMLSKKWSGARVIHYNDLKNVEIEKRYWPMRHRLQFVTAGDKIVFEYRSLEVFFDQLKIFFERQILKFHHSRLEPATLRLRSIPELVDEKKKKKRDERIQQFAS
jgi:hypothetical protein